MSESIHIELEYRRDESGRPEGTLRAGAESVGRSFVGTIELLHLLDEIADADDVVALSGDG